MHGFTWTVGLLLAASLIVGLARRVRAPYPALLAVAGVGAAYIPGAPHLTIDPELALAVFIAPVLVDAAFDASLRDLRRNWLPIGLLSLVVVGLTILAVAITAKLLFPVMPWPVAVALGAMVAPPDAASTTAVLSQLKAPRRIRHVLEGESLFNDAGALIVYRLAVAAALSGADLSWGDVAPRLALVAVASVIAGLVTGRVLWFVHAQIRHTATAILVQFLTTFLIWIAAEHLGLSPVIVIVVHAITISHLPDRMGARIRIPAFAVWETAVFVLNVLAFLLIGLQVEQIFSRLLPADRWMMVQAGLAVLGATIGIRVAWTMSYNTAIRLKNRLFGVRLPLGVAPPTFRSGLIVSWAGMRGILSLAAALALPEAFPFRDQIVFMVFCVVLGTLVLQGLTLGPLIKLLRLQDNGEFETEVEAARARALEAALVAVRSESDPLAAKAVGMELETALTPGSSAGGSSVSAFGEVRRRGLAAARRSITDLRRDGEIGDEAFHLVEEDLDRMELSGAALTEG